jgi:hypothetical protein
VKRSGKDEPVWIVIHICIEATLRISLYSYLYLKVVKMLCLSYYLLYFLFNKIGEREGGTCCAWKGECKEGVGGEVAQTMCTLVSKCKKDKRKEKKKVIPYYIYIYIYILYILYIS